MRKRSLVAIAAIAVALTTAPSAVAVPGDPSDWGPPPTSCRDFAGKDGCYPDWPNSMIDTWLGGIHITDHTLHVGDTLTVEAFDYGAASPVSWNWGKPECAEKAPSCTFKQDTPTNGWAQFNLGFSNPFGPASESDYYGVVGKDWYAIEGVVQRALPGQPGKFKGAQGLTVTASGDSYQPKPAVTNGGGRYTIWVKKGIYTIAVDGGSHSFCEESALPAACVRRARRTVEDSDITVNWKEPPRFKVSGTVSDGAEKPKPIRGATIRVRPQNSADGATETATTDSKGKYSMDVEQGDVVVDSTDKTLCVKGADAPPGQECARRKEIDLHSNVVVDFVRTGCEQEVVFPERMAAMGECFKEVQVGPVKLMKTEDPFWMNGLRMYPTSEVYFDKTTKTLVTDQPISIKLRLPDGTEKTMLYLPSLTLNFVEAEWGIDKPVDLSYSGLEPIGGFKLTWSEGSTTLTGKGGLSKQKWNIEDPEHTFVEADVYSLTVEATASNPGSDDEGREQIPGGLRRLRGAFAPGNKVVIPAGADKKKGAKYLKLKEVGGAYDFGKKIWRFNAKAETNFLGAGPASSLGLNEPPTVDATLDVDSNFAPQLLKISVGDHINRQLPYALFLQRLNLAIGADQLTPNSPFQISLGAGVSLGPAAEGKELAAVDGQFTLVPVGSRAEAGAFEDVALKGKGGLKIVGYDLLKGNLEWYPGRFTMIADGEANLEAPAQVKGVPLGGKFGLSGKASGWYDGINYEFGAEGIGTASLPLLGSLGVKWAAAVRWGGTPAGSTGLKEGLGLCHVSSRATTVPDSVPVAGGAQFYFGDPDEELYGFTYDWNTGEWKGPEGCNLAPYTRARPRPKTATAAAAAQTVDVPKGARGLGVRVHGSKTAPVVTISGPSGSRTADPDKPAQLGWVHVLPSGSDDTTAFALVDAKPGRYKITAKSGSVASVEVAKPAPDPEVSGEVSGSACAPVLTWRAKKIPGQEIRLLDAGDGGAEFLAQTAKSSGRLKLTAGGGGSRTIVAQILQGGILRTTLPVASYDAPSDVPAAPTGVRVMPRGKGLAVSWRASCRAASYSVAVGSAKPVAVRKTSYVIRTVPKSPKATVTITPVSAAGLAGTPVTRSLIPSAR
jgi:hypothetical protein